MGKNMDRENPNNRGSVALPGKDFAEYHGQTFDDESDGKGVEIASTVEEKLVLKDIREKFDWRKIPNDGSKVASMINSKLGVEQGTELYKKVLTLGVRWREISEEDKIMLRSGLADFMNSLSTAIQFEGLIAQMHKENFESAGTDRKKAAA